MFLDYAMNIMFLNRRWQQIKARDEYQDNCFAERSRPPTGFVSARRCWEETLIYLNVLPPPDLGFVSLQLTHQLVLWKTKINITYRPWIQNEHWKNSQKKSFDDILLLLKMGFREVGRVTAVRNPHILAWMYHNMKTHARIIREINNPRLKLNINSIYLQYLWLMINYILNIYKYGRMEEKVMSNELQFTLCWAVKESVNIASLFMSSRRPLITDPIRLTIS